MLNFELHCYCMFMQATVTDDRIESCSGEQWCERCYMHADVKKDYERNRSKQYCEAAQKVVQRDVQMAGYRTGGFAVQPFFNMSDDGSESDQRMADPGFSE